MAITVSYEDIRGALDATSSEYSDSELQFEKRQAEALVNDTLAPQTSNTAALELTGALLAAAYAADEQTVESVSQGSRSVSFATEESLSLFEQAKQMDPTGKLADLQKPSASLSVSDTR